MALDDSQNATFAPRRPDLLAASSHWSRLGPINRPKRFFIVPFYTLATAPYNLVVNPLSLFALDNYYFSFGD